MTSFIVALSATDASLIVALSATDATVHAAAVGFFALLAVVFVASRFDWSRLARGTRRPSPVYVRVDQRPGRIYTPPALRRRTAAAGGLAGLAVVAGIVFALAVAVVMSALVSSVTDLLR